ncbi:MAG: carboxymuconolactone decarboxylase family protein [Bacteroidetes bacterium]|nr:carboxymuconolactone decarboxylase family protein [Bacteroidota bacterium]
MENQRYNYSKNAPDAIHGMLEIEKYVHHSGLSPTIFELVKFRASQMNGCAYCMDMHAKDARAAGETEQRLYLVSAWREVSLYSEKERAALAWTEALTLISENDVPDSLYQEVKKQFDEKELIALTMAIVAINGWNRLSVAFKTPAGSYVPQKHK